MRQFNTHKHTHTQIHSYQIIHKFFSVASVNFGKLTFSLWMCFVVLKIRSQVAKAACELTIPPR